jgi:CDI immunity proteins
MARLAERVGIVERWRRSGSLVRRLRACFASTARTVWQSARCRCQMTSWRGSGRLAAITRGLRTRSLSAAAWAAPERCRWRQLTVLENSGRDLRVSRSDCERDPGTPDPFADRDVVMDRELRRHAAEQQIPTDESKRTLDTVDPPAWGPAPPEATTLIKRCHELRTKPLIDFTDEDLRTMIDQRVALDRLVPLALGQTAISHAGARRSSPGKSLGQRAWRRPGLLGAVTRSRRFAPQHRQGLRRTIRASSENARAYPSIHARPFRSPPPFLERLDQVIAPAEKAPRDEG